MKVYCLGELLIDMIGEEDGPGGPAVFRKFAGGAAGNVAVEMCIRDRPYALQLRTA